MEKCEEKPCKDMEVDVKVFDHAHNILSNLLRNTLSTTICAFRLFFFQLYFQFLTILPAICINRNIKLILLLTLTSLLVQES